MYCRDIGPQTNSDTVSLWNGELGERFRKHADHMTSKLCTCTSSRTHTHTHVHLPSLSLAMWRHQVHTVDRCVVHTNTRRKRERERERGRKEYRLVVNESAVEGKHVSNRCTESVEGEGERREGGC